MRKIFALLAFKYLRTEDGLQHAISTDVMCISDDEELLNSYCATLQDADNIEALLSLIGSFTEYKVISVPFLEK